MSNPNIKDYGYKKGQSGNPKGRPKRAWTMTGLLEEALEEQDEKGIPYKKTIAQRLTKLAHAGDLGAIKEVNNRIDGMPIQKNILAGDEESPLTINIESILNKAYGTVDKDSSSTT